VDDLEAASFDRGRERLRRGTGDQALLDPARAEAVTVEVVLENHGLAAIRRRLGETHVVHVEVPSHDGAEPDPPFEGLTEIAERHRPESAGMDEASAPIRFNHETEPLRRGNPADAK